MGRRRAVIENVSMMTAAARAVVFGAGQDQHMVLLRREYAGNRGKETRPAGAAVELHVGGEERKNAARAGADARPFLMLERTGGREFGVVVTQLPNLHWGVLLAPLGVLQLQNVS